MVAWFSSHDPYGENVVGKSCTPETSAELSLSAGDAFNLKLFDVVDMHCVTYSYHEVLIRKPESPQQLSVRTDHDRSCIVGGYLDPKPMWPNPAPMASFGNRRNCARICCLFCGLSAEHRDSLVFRPRAELPYGLEYSGTGNGVREFKWGTETVT